jgi:hypothetical protein
MAEPLETIHRLYQAFAVLDAGTMAACYASDASFSDEVFTLRGRPEIGGMWAMLCDAVRNKGRDDWSLSYGQVGATGDRGHAHWDARYRFSVTGRPVENHVEAQLRFDGAGLIVAHIDRFDFWRWSRQALGAPGVLLGWTPQFRRRVQATARARLARYLER